VTSLSNTNSNLAKKGFISFAALLLLFFWAFLPEINSIVFHTGFIINNIHISLVPLAVAMFIMIKKHTLTDFDLSGAWAGFLLILLGCFLYAITTWPFSFGYARNLCLVPVLAGVILASFGKKIFFKLIPIYIFVFLAIPIGPRLTSTLVIKPETLTLILSQKIMGLLPGISASLNGLDLTLSHKGISNIVAMGQTSRAFQLYFVYALIALFVFFSSHRSVWKYIIALIVTLPVIFLCNLIRFILLSAFTAYFNVGNFSAVPTAAAASLSVCLAYLIFILLFNLKINLFVEDEQVTGDDK